MIIYLYKNLINSLSFLIFYIFIFSRAVFAVCSFRLKLQSGVETTFDLETPTPSWGFYFVQNYLYL